MAAALIPLIAGLAPSLIGLIAGLVHRKAPVSEQQYGAGTGPVKFADVFGFVIEALQKAAAAGLIDKALPADETIKTVIQSVVTSMKMAGLLGEVTPPGAPALPVSPGALAPTAAGLISSGKVIAILVQQ